MKKWRIARRVLPRPESAKPSVEALEPRHLLAGQPLEFGAVYVEEDLGSDLHGDTFYLTFRGGAPGTQLQQVTIDGEQGAVGLDKGDALFDVLTGGLGADDAFAFTIISQEGIDHVEATVEDGSTRLVLKFRGFDPGERLVFSIDVDEAEDVQPGSTSPAEVNDGLDPITSGVEFQGSLLEAHFTAPDYHDLTSRTTFRNAYDAELATTELDLPPDNQDGKRDRSAGAVGHDRMLPDLASIRGHVYHDRNNNGIRQAGEEGLAGVPVRLIPIETVEPQEALTAVTDASGQYVFDNIVPGRYRVQELEQPEGYFDGLDAAGTVDGQVVGIAQNPGDSIEQIELRGGQAGIEYNFGELLPSSITGDVHLATPDGDCFSLDVMHDPVVGARVELRDATGQVLTSTVTAADGTFTFQDLLPGTYSVFVIAPEGLLSGGVQVGTVDGQSVGRIEFGGIVDIGLFSGQDGVDYSFCMKPPTSIAGNVYHDENLDGRRQLDEAPIAGVTVRLLDASGNLIDETQTDSSGAYTFTDLEAGNYSIVQVHPEGWLDGTDQAGTVAGAPRGIARNPGDRIDQIVLQWGDQGIEYNFGEFLPGSIAGMVHADLDGDCILDESEIALAGVRIDLFDASGQLVRTTHTDASGRYIFEQLRPGAYSVRETAVAETFHISQRAGSGGGDASEDFWIRDIVIGSGHDLVDYDFCEEPPGEITGYVFQDGEAIVLELGQEPPSDVSSLRDGRRTADDTPIAGVVLELRDGLTAAPIFGSDALPGIYPADEPIRTTSDAEGFYHFPGLRKGSYAVYQVHPEEYIDGIDSAGTTSGIAINRHVVISEQVLSTLVKAPDFDAILRIGVPPGVTSQENNFSEVKVQEPRVILFRDPEPRPVLPGFSIDIPGTTPAPLFLAPPPVAGYEPIYRPGFGRAGGYTWHLSVVNAGRPRGDAQQWVQVYTAAWYQDVHLPRPWFRHVVGEGRSVMIVSSPSPELLRPNCFDCSEATPIAGDFNGDGVDELGMYADGQWLLDLNGNGRWDEADLWAKLGSKRDQPVVGDWDGDGKDDIGIFGPAWPGDPRAVAAEPGLPDASNQNIGKPKNVPPTPDEATKGRRLLQHTRRGRARADLIDHVFHFGTGHDRAISGDWNGDGIATIGIFRDGHWRLDWDGDGQWTGVDRYFRFGQAGDIPVVGDFNGDGIDEIGVFRSGKIYLDINRNGQFDPADLVLSAPSDEGYPVVGDWDGDGVDEVAVYVAGQLRSEQTARNE